ncbi:periplasmic protein [compost metagenome]
MTTFLNNKEPDMELARMIRDRIKWDKRVSLNDLGVVVKDGTVIVSGYVDSSYKKNAALEVISTMEGVWEIDDRIIVPLDYYRSDEELKKLLQKQLSDILKISGEHIEVEVIDGIVTLEGEVYRPRLKAMAVGAAWEMSGVRDCLNLIEIREPPYRVPLHMAEDQPDDNLKGVFDGVN